MSTGFLCELSELGGYKSAITTINAEPRSSPRPEPIRISAGFAALRCTSSSGPPEGGHYVQTIAGFLKQNHQAHKEHQEYGVVRLRQERMMRPRSLSHRHIARSEERRVGKE